MKHRAYYGTLTEDPRSIAEGPGGSDIHYEGDPPGYFYDWEKEMRKEKNGKFKQSVSDRESGSRSRKTGDGPR